MSRKLFAAVSGAMLLSTSASAETPQYYLVKLQGPEGATDVEVAGIDAAGHAAGTVVIGKQRVAVHWNGNVPVILHDLGTGPKAAGQSYSAININTLGGISGMGVNSAGAKAGIYWQPDGIPWELKNAWEIHGVSDAGATVGIAIDGPDAYGSAAIWKDYKHGQPSFLPLADAVGCEDPVIAATQCYGEADAISPNGRYVGGVSSTAELSHWGTLWLDGAVVTNYGNWYVYATAINNSGVVVGEFDTGLPPIPLNNGVFHAFRWEAGTMIDLGSLPGATPDHALASEPTGINSSGVIVGWSEMPVYVYHGVMWKDDQIIDLNTLLLPSQLPPGTSIQTSGGINDKGEILVFVANNPTGPGFPPTGDWYVAHPAIPTSTRVTSNINASTYGQQIHLVARITPDSGAVPTLGQVAWYDGGTLLGSARLTDVGTASWEPSTLIAGNHEITAVFAGYAPYGSSTSVVFKQTVNQAGTRTTVMSSANPATHGQAFTLTAAVVPVSGTIAGTVTFMSGGASLGTATVDARTRQARLKAVLPKAGKYSISASYSGTANFRASASQALTLTVK